MSPLQPVPSKPLCASSCFPICSPKFIKGLSGAKAFPLKSITFYRSCMEYKGTFLKLLIYFSSSSLKFCRSGNTVLILQQWNLGSWPDWKVGCPHHSPRLWTVSCPFSSSAPGRSQQAPCSRTPTPGRGCSCTGDPSHLADTLTRGLRLLPMSFSIFFPKLCPQACGGMAFPVPL